MRPILKAALYMVASVQMSGCYPPDRPPAAPITINVIHTFRYEKELHIVGGNEPLPEGHWVTMPLRKKAKPAKRPERAKHCEELDDSLVCSGAPFPHRAFLNELSPDADMEKRVLADAFVY